MRSRLVRELLELIELLDRRVPRPERADETSIARDATALKARALQRIAELEHEATSVDFENLRGREERSPVR